MNLGERIKKARLKVGLSQKEVARKSGITVSFLSQLEKDKATPSLKSLKNIALAIGTRINYFLNEDTTDSRKIELVKKNTNEKIILESGERIDLHIR